MNSEGWKPYAGGQSIGKKDTQDGVILRDEEHELGARITVKQTKTYISISCIISGWMDHTRFFDKLPDALKAYNLMKPELASVLQDIAGTKSSDIKAWESISGFVMRFP